MVKLPPYSKAHEIFWIHKKLQKSLVIRQAQNLTNTVTRTTRRDEVEAEADMVAETITTDGKGRSSNLLINFSLFH